jgi:hypothetical protein
MGTTMRHLWRGAVVLALALLGEAIGAEVRVTYEVDQKAFKQVQSGDLLTFSLYDDPGCASLLYETVLAADSAAVTYDKPKRTKVKGGAKPAKVVVIQTVLGPGGWGGQMIVKEVD